VNAEELAKAPEFVDFLSKAHSAGLTQGQVDFMVGEFLDRSLKLQEALPGMKAEECVAELRKTWASDQQYRQEMGRAWKAAEAYAGMDMAEFEAKYGNDPALIRMLAKVGAELGEDTPPPPDAQASTQADLHAITNHPGYFDPKHPEHERLKLQMQQLMEKVHGTAPKKQGALIIS
jgi:hypothetical protein